MRGKNSGYNAGRKKAVVGADRPKLDYITNWLRVNSFGVRVSLSNYKFTNSNFKTIGHETDLILNGTVHLQHDTVKVHSEIGFERVENDKNKHRIRTLRRNADYLRANIPFCVLNQDLARELQLNEGALTVYLYYHTMMNANARLEL